MLALLWAPITSHCMFERLPGFEFLSCCTHEASECTDKEKDCETDSCAVVEDGLYKIQDNGNPLPEPTLAIAFHVLADEATLKDSGRESLRAARPPPHLAPAWQFFYCTAVPVRAPSLLA